MLYLISYDIAEKNNDYEALWAKLKEWGATKVLYSEWLVAAPPDSAMKLATDLEHVTMPSDRVLVQEVTSNAAWTNLIVSNQAFSQIVMRDARP